MALRSTLGTPAPRKFQKFQSVQRSVAAAQVQRPRAAVPAAPYVRKRPETPVMTGLQETGTASAVEHAQALQEQAGIGPSAQGRAEGGGSGGGGQQEGSGQQQGPSPEEQKYQQDQAEYIKKLEEYNAQIAQAGPSTSLVAPTPPAKQEGIFARFFSWLFGKKTTSLQASGDPVTDACAALVQRARQGDQNAMGMIASVRKSAQQGNPRARRFLISQVE